MQTIDYSIVLGDDILHPVTECYAGESLDFWLIAKWSEEASYWRQLNWDSSMFTAEISDILWDDHENHITTSQILSKEVERKSLVADNEADVPLSILLPNRPAKSVVLSVRAKGSSRRIAAIELQVALPLKVKYSFYTRRDKIAIDVDLGYAVDDYAMRFVPNDLVSLHDYEVSFVLQRVQSAFELSFASDQAVKLLNKLTFNLDVTWRSRSMISTFKVSKPMYSEVMSVIWNVPRLKQLQQCKLGVEVHNISTETINATVEIGEREFVQLEGQTHIKDIAPDEKRNVFIQCVPLVSGIVELPYRVKVGEQWFRPLFHTIVEIEP